MTGRCWDLPVCRVDWGPHDHTHCPCGRPMPPGQDRCSGCTALELLDRGRLHPASNLVWATLEEMELCAEELAQAALAREQVALEAAAVRAFREAAE